MASDVYSRESGRPGEGKEISRVGVEERVDKIERNQLLGAPHLCEPVSGKRAEIAEGTQTRTELSPDQARPFGDLRTSWNTHSTHLTN